jgi:pilus assembly protein Flp/PilA
VGQTQPDERISDAAGGRSARRLAARSALGRFLADQSGATAIEYGLICSLIFLVIITAVTAFGHNTTSLMNQVSAAVTGATS